MSAYTYDIFNVSINKHSRYILPHMTDLFYMLTPMFASHSCPLSIRSAYDQLITTQNIPSGLSR